MFPKFPMAKLIPSDHLILLNKAEILALPASRLFFFLVFRV